jgi:hypothetical protein
MHDICHACKDGNVVYGPGDGRGAQTPRIETGQKQIRAENELCRRPV